MDHNESQNTPQTAAHTSKMARHEQLTHSEKMMRGTAWLSAGQLLSRLIGALYIIPWAAWMGKDFSIANALFGIAYVPYAIFIEMATAGFPIAMTKQISQLNARNEYRAGLKLFRDSLYLMLGMGVFSFAVFYFIAPWIASQSPTVSVDDSVHVLRALAPALLLLPPLSLLRGFFQGYQQMAESAISQLAEQFVRVAYMLGTTFVIMKVSGGRMVDAVAQSTFAAFVGALVALAYMLWALYRERTYIQAKVRTSADTVRISAKESLLAMLRDSIPFVLLGIGYTATVLVDQFSFAKIMAFATQLSHEAIMVDFAIFTQNVNKITSIISSLTVAMTGAAIPLIAALYQQKDRKPLTRTIVQNMQLYFFLMFPAAMGLFVVARPMYVVFYPDDLGVGVLRLSCLMIIVVGFHGLLANALQAMGHHRFALKALGVALVTKVLTQFPLVAWFHGYGAVLATALGFGVSAYLLWQELYRLVRFNRRWVMKRALLIAVVTIMMMLIAVVALKGLHVLLPGSGKVSQLIKLVVVSGVGAAAYGYIMLRLRLMDRVLGTVAQKLRTRLRMR